MEAKRDWDLKIKKATDKANTWAGDDGLGADKIKPIYEKKITWALSLPVCLNAKA